MSFILDLPPDVETRLHEEAARTGVSADAVALRVLNENLPPSAPRVVRRPAATNLQMPAEEWEARFDAWHSSASSDAPAVALESLRRAALYEERV